MKVLIAPDSFKGSLKSPDVARAMAAGVRAAVPDGQVALLPVGDGGEGTLEALVEATGGSYETATVDDPLGRSISARLGLLGDGNTAFVEMAEASGLSRLTPAERDPLRADTRGTGELVRSAFQSGRSRILIGIGGSATNDAGAGLLTGLGVRILDRDGNEIGPGGGELARAHRLDLTGLSLPPGREWVVACDVTNPLTGPQGASAIYGPQKGATPEMIAELGDALGHFADVVAEALGKDCRELPGAGAAGGLGFALQAFLGARLVRGVDLVLDSVRFDEQLEGASFVLTGEGKIDRQTTAFGKTLTGIGARAAKAGVPVLALAGSVGDDLGDYRAAGISSVASIVPRPMSLEEAMGRAPGLIELATRRLVETFLAGARRL